MNNWDCWPKWNEQGTAFSTPRFNFSCSTTDFSGKTNKEEIALLKERRHLSFFRDITGDRQPKHIFELGYFQGGMPLFLADMIAPEKIVAIDFYPPTDDLLKLIEDSSLSTKIDLIGNVLQNDTDKIRKILDEKFGSQPLDLIIDDCSHYYLETKACFETIFGYLRPGGKYVIEDWGWTHWPGGNWQTDESHFKGGQSMTNLIFEIIMAMASDQGKISNVNILSDSLAVITRGQGGIYRESTDLRAMTNLAGGRLASLISNPPLV